MIKNRKFMLYEMAPLSPVLFYGYLAYNGLPLSGSAWILGVALQNLSRAWAGLCLGAVSFVLTEKIKTVELVHKTG